MNKLVQVIARYFPQIFVSTISLAGLTAVDLATANAQTFFAQRIPKEISWGARPVDFGLSSKIGQRFTFLCLQNGEVNRVYGTDLYGDYSSICTAAVHRGLITVPGGGSVTILIRSGNSFYNGTLRNEINSEQGGSSDASFVFIGRNGQAMINEPIYQMIKWDTRVVDLGIGQRLNQKFTYICRPNGEVNRVYGTDLYGDYSSVCTAAVHAGLISVPKGGKVTIEIRVGSNFYNGTTRNRIQSEQGGVGNSSFVFVESPQASLEQPDTNNSDNSSSLETTNIPAQSTGTSAGSCPDRSEQFVAGETDSFNIYICGQNRPTQYIGIAKGTGSSIRLNLASSSKGKYIAKNGSTTYTVTRNSLKITRNGRVLQTQPLRVSQWRN
jgi:hypothetical protein